MEYFCAPFLAFSSVCIQQVSVWLVGVFFLSLTRTVLFLLPHIAFYSSTDFFFHFLLSQNEPQPLADVAEFSLKIRACKDHQSDPNFCVVAR
jgi:hypothetical protein